MASGTLTAAASASLSANGTSTATGSITWTTPAFPDGVEAWDSVRISGRWSWSGKGNITRVTINGVNTSADTSFDVDITGKTSPMSITCVGNNKNATGANFNWTGLTVTFAYTQQGVSHELTISYDGRIIAQGEIEESATVIYDGRTIATVMPGQIRTLQCSGKYMATDVVIAGKTLMCSGQYMESNVTVEVSA